MKLSVMLLVAMILAHIVTKDAEEARQAAADLQQLRDQYPTPNASSTAEEDDAS